MDDWKAKQAAKASAAAALQAANPHLLAVSSVKGGALQAAAKNIRIELARAFPSVKFSIKSRRFSMGNAIDVRWEDGPVSKQVADIIDRYSAGYFDGMDDSYNYVHDAWRDAFGDAKYVHCQRDSSDKAIASAARFVFGRYGVDASKFPADGVVAAYRSGALYRIKPDGSGNFDLQDLVGQEISRRCWSLNKAPKAVAMAEEVAA